LVLDHGELTNSTNLILIIQQVQPNEIYNLGAQSHVAIYNCYEKSYGYESPRRTASSDALGILRILESVREQQPRSTRPARVSLTVWFNGVTPRRVDSLLAEGGSKKKLLPLI